MNYEYKSILAPIIKEFIKEKQALGFKYITGMKKMKEIDIFCIQKQLDTVSLPKELVVEFLRLRKGEKNATRTGQISSIRTLANFMIFRGHQAYVYPPLERGGYSSNYIPHIFTNEELHNFFKVVEETDHIKCPANNSHLTIFKILYSTGMRIGEVLNIKYKDIDFENYTFFINQAKNNKDRQIPIHKNCIRDIEMYINKYRFHICGEDYVFVNRRGKKYDTKSIYTAFRKYLWKAKIHHPGRSKGPCVHSFRHTFCVHRLRDWVLAGKDINALFPYLCAYLGHADTRCTEYYLRLTADLYPHIVSRCEEQFWGVDNEKK